MSFRDFLTYFGELEICHLTPDSVNNEDNSKKFEVFHFYGAWSFGSTAGGCGNDGNRKKIQLNEHETYPLFLQLSQNLTSDCLLISV